MKEIKPDVTVPCGSFQADRTTVINYITAFHLVGQPSTEDSQPCATDMAVQLTECRCQVTITYRHTNATDSPMFSLSPMLPMSDVRIGLTLIVCSIAFSDFHDVSFSTLVCVKMHLQTFEFQNFPWVITQTEWYDRPGLAPSPNWPYAGQVPQML